MLKGRRKKGLFLSGTATKRGLGGGKGLATKKKDFFKLYKKNVATKLEWGGG